MFVDSNKTLAEIEAAIKEQQAAKKSSKKRSSKRVVEPTRMVVEDETTQETVSEMETISDPILDEIELQANDVKSIEGVDEIPEDAEVHEGATLNGMSLADLMKNL